LSFRCSVETLDPALKLDTLAGVTCKESRVGPQPDYSREALGRLIDYVVEKGLVNPSTAQGWRVATTKVLEELPDQERADVRRIDVDATFRAFLNRNPGRLSPASVGEYRRRVGRAIEEFVSWIEDPGGYGNRSAAWAIKTESRLRPRPARLLCPEAAPARAPVRGPLNPRNDAEMMLDYPLRPGLLARVVLPRDLTVEEARRMGAFLVTLAGDFKPPDRA
jgi:hypothetical protein